MFSNRFFPYQTILFLAGFLIVAGCSKSDDQREFENQALVPPFKGITEMTSQGEKTENGNIDSDDWNISPRYIQRISVLTPAYPNPINYGQTMQITIDFGYDNTANEIAFFAKSQNTSESQLQFLFRESDLSIIDTFSINTAQFAQESGVGLSNIYRIFIYDGKDNLITYGDVKIGVTN
ncbi:hypothetical protein CK503_01890 [Aliifodinibius salipaludis]|uniref:Lipoprotein n=1 Tax=Fodinibius salipaludis TaxID=2032627 RepID=A0A2A2GGC7_9BACT|nr:hypothetical protein [Aliifodinibius salipaludis]PAU95832.1 hypothetical protein CK503_01890 [Aliifodinibius salipaludis]